MIEDKIDTVFISLEKKTFRYSFTMNFNCTNNIEECEEILIGLKVAVNHGIKKINVIFYSKLGMAQIKETYASRNKRFQQYRIVILDYIEAFDAFGISQMERNNNKIDYMIANVAIKLHDISFSSFSKTKMHNIPLILDNIENQHVFEDDKDIN